LKSLDLNIKEIKVYKGFGEKMIEMKEEESSYNDKI